MSAVLGGAPRTGTAPAARRGPVTIGARYVLFAVVATAVNFATQEVVITVAPVAPLALSILAGTAVGFAVKYILDKKWIFYDRYTTHSGEAWKVSFTQCSASSRRPFSGASMRSVLDNLAERRCQIHRRCNRPRHRLCGQNARLIAASSSEGLIQLEGWGRYARFESELVEPAGPAALRKILARRPGVVAVATVARTGTLPSASG